MDELEKSGHLQGFRSHQNTLLVALDGVTYHSSTTIHCDECLHRQDSQGTRHYYHSAITPVIVKPNSPHGLPLPPALIVPQDGHEKQDCAPGRHPTAVKRWLAHQAEHDRAWTKTYLGDDLYANQPLCQLLAETDHQFFVFVCKPDSHTTLYQEIALLEVDDAYRLLRDTLAVRRTFFHDLKALTRYLLFDSFDSLFAFMLDGLELTLPPP